MAGNFLRKFKGRYICLAWSGSSHLLSCQTLPPVPKNKEKTILLIIFGVALFGCISWNRNNTEKIKKSSSCQSLS
jgi:hypothetical protein